MSTAMTILDGNNYYGIKISLIQADSGPVSLCGPENAPDSVGFGYVVKGEISVTVAGRAERFPQHSTCVFTGKSRPSLAGREGAPAHFLLLTVARAAVVDLLDAEKTSLSTKGHTMLSGGAESFFNAAPANETILLLLGQVMHSPFNGAMRQTYLELKGMELALEYVSLYFIRHGRSGEGSSLRSKVAHAWQMMQDNLEQPFSISQLAKTVGMSESSLKRAFRSMYGDSIFSSFQRYRMSAARKLLEESKCSVAEVAYRVGYANPCHFSRAFSRFFGVPPRECR